jgi:hypothetical protein
VPTRIKTALSALVAAITAAAVWCFADAGKHVSQYATLFLGAFMIVSMWIFPEVSRTGTDDMRTDRRVKSDQ